MMEGDEAAFIAINAQDDTMAVQEARAWIEAVTGDKLPYDDFRKSLESGVVLCEFMEKIRPTTISKINRRASAIAHLDNIRQFLQACRIHFKLRGDQLFEITDLQDLLTQKSPAPEGIRKEAERKLRNVCVTLYWLGRTMSSRADYVGPQLCLEAFENMVSGENLFSPNNREGLQEVTVHMTTNNGGFGFQIVGGHDCSVPATVDRVVVGGSAESRGLQPNDIIVALNGQDVTKLSHLELIRLIKQSGSNGSIVLGLLRRASFKEFSPSSDGKYPSSTGSPLPNKTQSPVLLNNTGRRASEEHIAKSELLVNTAQKPNTVYVGDSSGEDSDNAIRKEEWSGSPRKSNQEEEESMKKLQNDQELRRKQEEEMAQIYPAKYSWTNGGNENEFNNGGSSKSPTGDVKVFETYGAALDSPLIRAHVDYSTHLQIEKEMKSVSQATPRIRHKWQKEENRSSISPVQTRKLSHDHLEAERHRTSSAGQDDKAALEEQLKKLQLEAQLAREEAEALKREKAEDEARIRHEEQVKYQEELKRQSMDAQRLLTELQQQQMELNQKQQSLMQATNSLGDIDKERAEIRRQLEEQRKAIIDQWQQLDQERQLMEEKRHLMRLEEEQRKQLERQKEIQQQELDRLQAEKERREQELMQLQQQEQQQQQHHQQQQHQQYQQEEEEEEEEQQEESGHRRQKRDSWKMLSEVTQLPPEVEQRREMERRAEMQRQMERLQKKEKHKSPSTNSYNQMSPSASWSAQNNTSAVVPAAVHVTKPVQSSTYSHDFCSSCAALLGSERAMSITNLGLLYHLRCFMCCVCHAPLATGLERTHVHVRNSRPHCKFCYSTDTGLLATEC